MALPLVYRRRVGRDLAGGYVYYEGQKADLGKEFLAAVELSFESIERSPELYMRAHLEVRRAIVSRFPYAVFYLVESERIVVLRVLHTASDPKRWPQPRKVGR